MTTHLKRVQTDKSRFGLAKIYISYILVGGRLSVTTRRRGLSFTIYIIVKKKKNIIFRLGLKLGVYYTIWL